MEPLDKRLEDFEKYLTNLTTEEYNALYEETINDIKKINLKPSGGNMRSEEEIRKRIREIEDQIEEHSIMSVRDEVEIDALKWVLEGSPKKIKRLGEDYGDDKPDVISTMWEKINEIIDFLNKGKLEI